MNGVTSMLSIELLVKKKIVAIPPFFVQLAFESNSLLHSIDSVVISLDRSSDIGELYYRQCLQDTGVQGIRYCGRVAAGCGYCLLDT